MIIETKPMNFKVQTYSNRPEQHLQQSITYHAIMVNMLKKQRVVIPKVIARDEYIFFLICLFVCLFIQQFHSTIEPKSILKHVDNVDM